MTDEPRAALEAEYRRELLAMAGLEDGGKECP